MSNESIIAKAARRCPVMDSRGYLCDAPPMTGLMVPLCKHHAAQVLLSFGFRMPVKGIKTEADRRADAEARTRRWIEREDQQKRRRRALLAISMVYYVAIGDHVKIGYTSNIKRRLSQLRVEPDALLAVEPGGHDLEVARHKQFRADRIHVRREDFRLSDSLREHIAAVVAKNGPPKSVVPPQQSGVIEIRQAESA